MRGRGELTCTGPRVRACARACLCFRTLCLRTLCSTTLCSRTCARQRMAQKWSWHSWSRAQLVQYTQHAVFARIVFMAGRTSVLQKVYGHRCARAPTTVMRAVLPSRVARRPPNQVATGCRTTCHTCVSCPATSVASRPARTVVAGIASAILTRSRRQQQHHDHNLKTQRCVTTDKF